MSDLENKEDGAIHLTQEELEFIKELEQEEEDILSGRKAMKGMATSDDRETVSRASEAAPVSGAGAPERKASETRISEKGGSETRRAEPGESVTKAAESATKAAGSGSARPTGGEALQDRPTGGRPAPRSGLSVPQGAARPRRPQERSGERRPREGYDENRRPREKYEGERRTREEYRSGSADRGRYSGQNRRPEGYEARRGERTGRPEGGAAHSGKITMENRVDNFFRNHKQMFFFISRALIPFTYFYYEAVFNLTTVRNFFGMQTFYILLFSVFFGMIGSLLSSIAKNRTVNMWLKAGFIFLPVIPFLIEYFVYLQFKVFYDLNTVVHGAADAAGGFKEDIFRLITSPQGILNIFLFLLPTVLFLVFELAMDKKHLLSMKTGSKRKVKMAIITVASYIICLILIACVKKYRLSYDSQYNFQSAVNNFGLMTSVRKEIWRGMTGASKDAKFDIDVVDDSQVANDTTQPATQGTSTEKITDEQGSEVPVTEAPQPKTYVANRYPISFSELAKNDSGTYADLDMYISSVNASMTNEYTGLFEGKNLIFLSAEAFSGDIIDPKLTPTLYRLATKGINFTDYTQPATAGTTGGEYSNLIGFLPTMGGQSMKQLATYNNYFTMGSQLDRLGYYGKMYHNNNYTYYSRNLTHINLGYCDGFEGPDNDNGYQAVHCLPDGTVEKGEAYISPSWPESDLDMIKGTFPQYVNKQPFNIYYMTVSGHSAYGVNSNAMTRKHWDQVANLPYSEDVKSYIAANLELEDALTWLVENLEKAGIANDTVIVLSADHFPYGLDPDGYLGNFPKLSELYGYNVTNDLQKDHNRLIIWSGCLENMAPITVDTPVCAIDILPTLSNLFGTSWDSRLLPGRDVFSTAEPIMFTLSYNWKTDKGTYLNGDFTPKNAAEKLPDDYVDRISKIVKNKINYMYGVLETDYFGHLYNLGVFPEIEKKYDYTKAPVVWREETTPTTEQKTTETNTPGNVAPQIPDDPDAGGI